MTISAGRMQHCRTDAERQAREIAATITRRSSSYPPVIVLEKTAKALATLDRWSAGLRHLVGARE
jgi:hypothetical protein